MNWLERIWKTWYGRLIYMITSPIWAPLVIVGGLVIIVVYETGKYLYDCVTWIITGKQKS